MGGEQGCEEVLLRPDGWWEAKDIDLLVRTSVMNLDPSERTARLSTKEEVRFGQVLLATGATRAGCVSRGPISMASTTCAFGNSDGIRADADASERVAVIAGSYIACEVAATLAARGTRCTMVMHKDVTLERLFGAGTGASSRVCSRSTESTC